MWGVPDTPEFELVPYEAPGGPGFVQCSNYPVSIRTKAETVEGCHTLCAEREECEFVTFYPADAVTVRNQTGNAAGDQIEVKDHNDWPKTCYLIDDCGEQEEVRDTEGLKANTYKKVRSSLSDEVDWALVMPSDPRNHRPIQSGELVSFRSP